MLYWAPGLLVFDGETYDRGVDLGAAGVRKTPWIESKEVTPRSSRPVTERLNLEPDMRMVWKVLRHDGYLEVFPVCGHRRGRSFSILLNLTKSLVLRGCPHDSAAPAENPGKIANYKGPIDPGEGRNLWLPVRRRLFPELQIDVVAVGGDAGLQMFAVSCTFFADPLSQPRIVIRSDSCMQCCLDLCRSAGVPLLIF